MKNEKEALAVAAPEQGDAMALPPETSAGQRKTRKRGLFSAPLFKESLHSNRRGLTAVSVGNALIMVIIVSILSTLHINSTATALADLFDNADYETSIKGGAISLYSAYGNTAEAYESFLSADEQAKSVVGESVEKVNDPTLISSIDAAKKLYDLTYRATTGSEEVKNATAKNATLEVANKTIETSAEYSDQEKLAAKSILSYYFTLYGEDKTKTDQEILKEAIPLSFADLVSSSYGLDEEKKGAVHAVFSQAVSDVYDSSKEEKQAEVEASLKLLPLLSSSEEGAFVSTLCDDLSELYQTDKAAYLADPSIRGEEVSSSCQKEVMATLSEYAYYQYLPDFTVEYKTNELGWPIRLVGTGKYGSNGNEIMEEVAVKIYNPDVCVKESEKMGKTSNMLQKMRKEALTGEPYSELEISLAKEEADSNLKMISGYLSSFMKDYLIRDGGKNAYFDGDSIDKDGISYRVEKEISRMAQATLIQAYNEKHDPKIETIEEITVENSSMSGTQMMTLVKGYASGGISSYETYYSDYLESGYSLTESNLLAMNKGSQGVMAQLPTSVDESLKEMGQMNTYGIIVGVVAFGIAALLIPMVYTILLAKGLVSEKVETGSLAFTLSTPTTRASFVFTQACYLIFSEVVMALSLLAASLLTREIGILAGSADLSTSLPIKDLCLYALGNFMVAFAVSGINFLASCHFNKTAEAIGTGGGLTIFFFICSILGLFATKAIPGTIRITMMSIFSYMTIDSLFDPLAVMSQDYATFFFKLMFLLLIAIFTYVLGGLRFRKKDLPL